MHQHWSEKYFIYLKEYFDILNINKKGISKNVIMCNRYFYFYHAFIQGTCHFAKTDIKSFKSLNFLSLNLYWYIFETFNQIKICT